MFLRFRNRFKAGVVEIHPCRCGVNFSRSVEGGRETFLHEEPWCEPFQRLVQAVRQQEEARLTAGQVLAPGVLVVLGEGQTEAEVRELAVRAEKERWS